MSNYIKTTDFAIKDTYAAGDPRKIAKGADVDTEFNNIATAVNSKTDASGAGIANGYCPLSSAALVTKTFQWTTTAYEDAANAFTQPQSISASGTLLTLTDSSTSTTSHVVVTAASDTQGVNVKLVGNGATPSKTIRVINGTLQFLDDTYTHVLCSVSDAGNMTVQGTVTAAAFSGNGGSITYLNASAISGGSIGASFVPSAAVTQYASAMKCRNLPAKGGTNITLQSGGSPSGGVDGDVFYIY